MPRTTMHPYVATLVTSAARTSTSYSDVIDFPDNLSDLSFYLISGAGTGTSPTLDVAIEVTVDDGTTFIPRFKFTQVTTGAVKYVIDVKASRTAEAGAHSTLAYTGSAVAANAPISKKIRVYWTVGGTNPSFTFAVYCIGNRGWF